MNTASEPINQSQTTRVLLGAGASASLRLLTPFQQRTLMGTIHLSPMKFDTFALFPDLVQAGLMVEEEDLIPMKKRVRNGVGLDDNAGPIILSLLKCLKRTGDNSGGPVQRLYSILYQHAQTRGLDLNDLLSENGHDEFAYVGNRLNILESMIKNNDVIALERVVGENRVELLKKARFHVGKEEWTAVHLACGWSSLDVLELLLKIGIDPEITTHQGTRPIHLCQTVPDGQDALGILLRHHVSTTANSTSLGTIWHLVVEKGDIRMLKVLISLAPDKSEALQIASGSGQTAMCLALDKQNREAINLLLDDCPTPSFWKSSMPLYRQAARLGSVEVVQKLLDMGIPPDDFDEDLGSPLHDINLDASVSCIELLVETFPHCYRQRKDGRTPFQSFFLRAMDDEYIRVPPTAAGALLPAAEESQPEEMVEKTVGAWPVFCSTVVKYIPEATKGIDFIKKMFAHVIDAGLMSVFEERHKASALVLFATELDQASSTLLPRWLAMRQDPLSGCDAVELPLLKNWECLSWMLLELVSETAFWDSAAHHHSVSRLLSHAILHDDCDLVEQLLHNGVDVHRRVDSMSALEIACLSEVRISEETLRCLLSYAKADRLNEHNERVNGFAITHFVATHSPVTDRSVWKLRQILKAGANANAVSPGSLHDPALIFHIRGRNFSTAEVLLEFGADPWLTNSEGMNASLAAIENRCPWFVKAIAKHSISRKLAAKWNQTWKDTQGLYPGNWFSGGNAFHLAAIHGFAHCMQVYLDEKWLDDLESVDDDLQTPMHYAALYGQCETIRFLHKHGCDIDRISRHGKSPLHLAVGREHLDAVIQLLRLGADMKVGVERLLLLACTLQPKNPALINSLVSRDKKVASSTFQSSFQGSAKIADAFYMALVEEDLNACEMFISHGLPIDFEMRKPWPVTPLMIALSDNMSSRVVKWLLRKGAKVSIVFEGLNMPQYATALEAAIADQSYNNLLPTLVRRYREEGGDFSRLKQTPLHVAVWKENYEGLRTLLDALRQTLYNTEDIVNQKNDLFGGIVSLHWAASQNSVDATKLLISNGANLELTDVNGFTPLHYAADGGSIDVLKLLMRLVSCTEPLTSSLRLTPLMLACWQGHIEATKYLLQFEQNITQDTYGRDIVHITLADADESSHVKLGPVLFSRSFDLHRVDINGGCAIYSAMACSRHWALRYLLREYPLSLRIQDIQWSSPYSQLTFVSNSLFLANIIRGYRLVHRYLGRGEPLKVSDSVTIGKSSLLYLAASNGLVAAVDDLLSIGIDIESQVCEEGTALTIAAAHGQLDVVRYLVRQGANIFQEFNCSQESKLANSRGRWEVLQWLLVGRYTDQAKIKCANSDENEEDGQVKEWIGVKQVRVSLKWEWKRRRAETMLEYANRFQSIMKALRGRVVDPDIDEESESSEEDLSVCSS